MSLDDVVTLNISRSAPAVSRQGFGVALILGSTITDAWDSDRIRTYTSAKALLSDGFASSDPEYKRALALTSQDNKPAKFKVGRRLAAVAQIDTLTPDVTDQEEQDYTITIDDVDYTFTSDASPTAAEVVTGLKALISADSDCAAAATGTTTVVLTGKTPGIGFSTEHSDNLSMVHTAENVGIDNDLAAIAEIDDDWYALDVTTTADAEVLKAAAYIEATRKIFIYATNSGGIIASGSTDIASKLKAKSYARTAVLYSADYASGAAAAWLGGQMPLQPGSSTYKFKTLKGITPDNLSPTQFTNAKGKNCNVYTTVGGAGMTEEGVMAVGEFIDTIVGIDWIDANMKADLFQDLRDNNKIPFTDIGGSVLQKSGQNRLNLAVKADILTADPAPVFNVPLVKDVDPAARTVRRFSGITFNGVLAGAVHSLEINGNVTV